MKQNIVERNREGTKQKRKEMKLRRNTADMKQDILER